MKRPPRAMWTERIGPKATPPRSYVAGSGSGGSWWDTPQPEPVAVIHLPSGRTHEVHPPARPPIGFRR